MTSWRMTFDALEASAERGNAEASQALGWISATIAAGFRLAKESPAMAALALNGGDPCERVAEALAVWLKESDESRFDAMRGQRFSVSSLDDSAHGMERLRDQSEFIVLAYPSAESTPAELAEQWTRDMDSGDMGDGFGYALAGDVIRQWAADNAESLAARIAERVKLEAEEAAKLEAADSEALELGEALPEFEPDWPPFRLYVRNESESDNAR